ncbi:hypothetical protein ARMGADRAFT_660989 [Armillaria gallica]|uniref:Uncharacterized protein n=1 Tax=Armillaria gallica TaxID=47427 RepID=A0A2H3DRT1_ARMGA|nr:hypothetical protein ARMGADRAFT_660989 [Armillaria gallica]
MEARSNGKYCRRLWDCIYRIIPPSSRSTWTCRVRNGRPIHCESRGRHTTPLTFSLVSLTSQLEHTFTSSIPASSLQDEQSSPLPCRSISSWSACTLVSSRLLSYPLLLSWSQFFCWQVLLSLGSACIWSK